MVTVKADAYGHGIIRVSKELCSYGVDYLGVASIDEGIRLRQEGIKVPILILGLILKTDIEALFRYDLTSTVCEEHLAQAINRYARGHKKSAKVHIKIDTGMGRIGIRYPQAVEVIKKICGLGSLVVEGLYTHFAFADSRRDFTLRQIDIFNNIISELKEFKINIPLLHAANSAGVINYAESHFNMVRPGLVIYGLSPAPELKIRIKPVLSLKTRIVYVKRVPASCGISYGHTYITNRPANIVTLPIGYGDGYPRNLSDKASVLVKGKLFRIAGRICMDQIMVDIGNTRACAGDEVVLIGSQGKNSISVEELAELSGTIPYEIVCGLGSRIPRVYVG